MIDGAAESAGGAGSEGGARSDSPIRMLGATDVVNALSLPLDLTPVPREQVVAGSPSTGWAQLASVSDSEIGVWEMTPGVMTDTEVDEVFVVLEGKAVIEFADGRSMTVSAGDVVKLDAGARTTWAVTETLRKIYVTPGPG